MTVSIISPSAPYWSFCTPYRRCYFLRRSPFAVRRSPAPRCDGSQHDYRPEIDGLRAVAVVAVIINHFYRGVLPSGHLGVDIFFVISGYVILGSLLSRQTDSIIDFIFEFYSRRIRRLVPALALFVILCGVAICLVTPKPELSLKAGIYSLFGLSNIFFLAQSTDYFAPATQYNAFIHTWSLGVEEQFYLVFPIVVYACVLHRRRKNGNFVLFAIMAALTAASLVYYIKIFPTDPIAAFFLMPARFWELGLGAITFLVLNMWRSEIAALGRIAGIAAAVLVISLFASPHIASLTTILVAIVTAILIASLTPNSITYECLTLRPVQFVGKISYSLYLWHWGVLSVGTWLIGNEFWSKPVLLILSVVAATLSYVYVEAPLRRASTATPNWKVITVGAYACFLSALTLNALDVPLKSQLANIAKEINPLRFQPQAMMQQFMPCHLPDHGRDPIAECLAPIDRHKKAIYVIGDSHATNHVPSIMLAAQKFNNLEVHYLVEWGFIPSLGGVDSCKDISRRPCMDNSFQRHLDFFTQNLKPDDIVIFSWARDSVLYEGPLPRKPMKFAIDNLRAKLARLRSVVTGRGAVLAFIDDIAKPCNNEVNWQIIYTTGRYDLCSTTVAISREDRQPLTDLYKSLLTSGVRYFDMHDTLCAKGVCGIYDPVAGALIYADNSPHFPPSRPSPLVNEWVDILTKLLAGKPAA